MDNRKAPIAFPKAIEDIDLQEEIDALAQHFAARRLMPSDAVVVMVSTAGRTVNANIGGEEKRDAVARLEAVLRHTAEASERRN